MRVRYSSGCRGLVHGSSDAATAVLVGGSNIYLKFDDPKGCVLTYDKGVWYHILLINGDRVLDYISN